MVKQLWAPWRLEYIAQADEQEGSMTVSGAGNATSSGRAPVPLPHEATPNQASTHAEATTRTLPHEGVMAAMMFPATRPGQRGVARRRTTGGSVENGR